MPNTLAKTPKASSTELLNLAARIESLAEAFEKYGMTRNYLNSASSNLRSAVGHAMIEVQQEETVVVPEISDE